MNDIPEYIVTYESQESDYWVQAGIFGHLENAIKAAESWIAHSDHVKRARVTELRNTTDDVSAKVVYCSWLQGAPN